MVRPLLIPRFVNHLVATVLVAAAILATAGTAHAQFAARQPLPATAEATTTVTERDWYGWEIVAADGAVLGMSVAARDGHIALAWLGSGAFVHAAHGHSGRAATSVALRVGLPLGGIALGLASAKGCSGELCDLGAAVAGGLVGMGVAEIADVAMATDETTIVVPVRPARWTPVASVKSQSATIGFAATF